jgi:FkbM family methyltransferase
MALVAGNSGIEVRIARRPVRLHPMFTTQAWEDIEPEAYNAFANSLSPGSKVVDIGAHIGTYSLLALNIIGENGRIVAYEPNDLTREHLLRHLSWADQFGVTTVRSVCCGAENGETSFYFAPGKVEGMNGMVPVAGFKRKMLQVAKLDDELTLLNVVPDIIKIDVEGAEWDVLKGATNTLKCTKPILFLSLHPEALVSKGESVDEILEWLTSFGYKHEVVSRDHEIHVLAK